MFFSTCSGAVSRSVDTADTAFVVRPCRCSLSCCRIDQKHTVRAVARGFLARSVRTPRSCGLPKDIRARSVHPSRSIFIGSLKRQQPAAAGGESIRVQEALPKCSIPNEVNIWHEPFLAKYSRRDVCRVKHLTTPRRELNHIAATRRQASNLELDVALLHPASPTRSFVGSFHGNAVSPKC